MKNTSKDIDNQIDYLTASKKIKNAVLYARRYTRDDYVGNHPQVIFKLRLIIKSN